jgi:hypothetical protein
LNPAAILNFNASKPFLLFFFSSKSTSKTNENDFYYIWQWQYTNVHFWSVINFLREKVPLCSPCRPVRNFNLLHVIILQFCFVLITRAKIKKKKIEQFYYSNLANSSILSGTMQIWPKYFNRIIMTWPPIFLF